jgi:hypothetical protein
MQALSITILITHLHHSGVSVLHQQHHRPAIGSRYKPQLLLVAPYLPAGHP